MNNQFRHSYVGILAGGVGSRFWPISRSNKPKQFLDILGRGRTLIQDTFDRFATFIPTENIFVITTGDYSEIVTTQLPNLVRANILVEPQRRNTAASIAYLSFKLQRRDPEATVVIAPSDHLITDNTLFERHCADAICFAMTSNSIITFGIQPSYPNTGYGYIRFEESGTQIKQVIEFVEKPAYETAVKYIEEGQHLWNAGIFVWRNDTFLKSIDLCDRKSFLLFDQYRDDFDTENEHRAVELIYDSCENISIDMALIERSNNVFVIPSSFGWSDLGTWSSVYDNLQKDECANASFAPNQMLVETENCLISIPPHKLLVAQGLKDYIVVDSDDVILICRKEKEQEIRNYVTDLRAHKKGAFL